MKSSIGEIDIRTPRDRDGSFEPQLISKRAKDVSGIKDKVLSIAKLISVSFYNVPLHFPSFSAILFLGHFLLPNQLNPI